MTYDDALAVLGSLTNYERLHRPSAMRRVPLERMRWLCERLGHPERRFRSILVAGTDGKGSICAMIDAILRAAGRKTGLYTSPHLRDVRERIRVGASPGPGWISESELASLVEQLHPLIEEAARSGSPHGGLTYFEVMTAAALLHFAQQRVDLAVLEVGLGGRLDATNVVDQAVSVIAPVGVDHTQVLGKDVLSIAREKLGILKADGSARTRVISAAQAPEVAVLLRETAEARGYQLVEFGRQVFADVIRHHPRGLRLVVRGLRGRYDELELPLLGSHQAQNAALAIAAVEALTDSGLPHEAVRSGLARVRWPGRLEVAGTHPLVVLDGAHNPMAAQALRTTLETLWPGRAIHVVLGVSVDKSARDLGRLLGPMAASVTCTTSRHPRAMAPKRLAAAVAPFSRRLAVIPEAVDAYTYVVNRAQTEDVIVVTGSLFLVGELRSEVLHARDSRRMVRRTLA